MFTYLLESLFNYIKHGVRYFRIDAVPFLWKEIGTNCSHHPKTHLFVKFVRAIFEKINSKPIIITESNAPHHENKACLGNEDDEAHLVYNFSLSPLILHAYTFQNTHYLKTWARSTFDISEVVSFLNFTSTHDGIGLRGIEGIISNFEIEQLCLYCKDKGGQVSYKTNSSGIDQPYELNISWASYFYDYELSEECNFKKLVHSHAIILFLPGIPAMYIHNFLGTLNWIEGVRESGMKRRINRKKLNYPDDITDRSRSIQRELLKFIKIRKTSEAFSPFSYFKIIESSKNIFAFVRASSTDKFLIILNVSKNFEYLNYNKITYEVCPFELVIKKLLFF